MAHRAASVAREELRLQSVLGPQGIRAVSGEVSRKGCFLSCDVHQVKRGTGLEAKSREPRDQAAKAIILGPLPGMVLGRRQPHPNVRTSHTWNIPLRGGITSSSSQNER